MFGLSLSLAAHNCARLLFVASIVMLLAGIVKFVSIMTDESTYFAMAEHIFLSCFSPSACLLFAAVLTHRLAGCRGR